MWIPFPRRPTRQRRIFQPAIASIQRNCILQVPEPRKTPAVLIFSIKFRLNVEGAACFDTVVQSVRDRANDVSDCAATIGQLIICKIKIAESGKLEVGVP
jgi:hypothetical protein